LTQLAFGWQGLVENFYKKFILQLRTERNYYRGLQNPPRAQASRFVSVKMVIRLDKARF
jgi:hypothetical protein